MTPALNVRQHVWPVLYILVEVADAAADFFVRLHGEGDDGDEAECEPFPVWGSQRGAEVGIR